MKSSKRRNLAIAAIGSWWLFNVVVPAKTFHYLCAAKRDERKGFPHTAAMEWRKAAELVAPNTAAAEYSWRQWERIMQMPRRLAGPIGVCETATLPLAVASASRPDAAPAIDQFSLQMQREKRTPTNYRLISSTRIFPTDPPSIFHNPRLTLQFWRLA